MVKTKVLGKKNTKQKEFEKNRGNKKVIEKNLFEQEPLKKGQYRDKENPFYLEGEEEPGKELPKGLNNGWWQGMKDGETCRTADSKKVHVAISMSINEGRGINIQGIPEGKYYFWYMTRIMTKKDAEPISKAKGVKKK